ncbi:hypothetical protein RRG08_036043 [Elysia crispata]|uniref:Uncharacterized protein n=1 Tax=Elysia crispata TaxID=231223 RepID=A0AAE1E151_9GAST|nr:hypothetical protein RRG08_036043 [Elysia crispata]
MEETANEKEKSPKYAKGPDEPRVNNCGLGGGLGVKVEEQRNQQIVHINLQDVRENRTRMDTMPLYQTSSVFILRL